MGTDYIYERGGMALQNCGYTDVTKLSKDARWAMNALMSGVGIGFGVRNAQFKLYAPNDQVIVYEVPDTREGWCTVLEMTIALREKPNQPRLVADMSKVRPSGALIRGFGGTASGPEPLEKLLARVDAFILEYIEGRTSALRCATDIMNAIGACVVAGNVRRSAEIALGDPFNTEFLNLKNYGTDDAPGPAFDRREIGWMSNNTVVLSEIDHFKTLNDIGELVQNNGEPGVMNLLNVQKYGRYGEEMPDLADGCNPCAEQPLEDKEVCCLVEVFPTRITEEKHFYEALELAQIYAHTVSLLPTDEPETNAVIARNHRIGESLSGIADWFDKEGASRIITYQREGYKLIREANKRLAQAAGVPESIRVTTVKPSGTISQLAGVSSGMHYPVHTRFIRRVRIGMNTPLVPLLIEAGVPYEQDVYSDNTWVFSFPVETDARRAQRDISMWQKGAMVMLLQKHWADNMVSNTITFDPKTEAHQVPDFLAHFVPFVKTFSLLPDKEEGAYAQMPYEAITQKVYQDMSKNIKEINWSKFGGSDGMDSRFCNNDSCDV